MIDQHRDLLLHEGHPFGQELDLVALMGNLLHEVPDDFLLTHPTRTEKAV